MPTHDEETAIEAERVETAARREATRILRGADPNARDYRAAGYTDARKAAEALVDVPRSDAAVRERTILLVMESFE